MKKTYIFHRLLILFCFLKPATGNTQLSKYNSYKEKIYIHTNHVFFTPGDVVYFRLYLVDAATQLPSGVSSTVNVDIVSPAGNVLKTLHYITATGSITGSYDFPETASGGIYKLRAYTTWMKNEKDSTWFTREITVQKMIAPRVLMKLDFPQKGYGPGDTVKASYSIRNLNNKPIAGHTAAYTLSLNGTAIKTATFITDTAGKALLQFSLPDTLHTTDALLNITVNYDSYIEAISRSIPISLHKVDLQLLPEGGTLLCAQPAHIAFIGVNEYGRPCDVRGVVKDSRGNTCARFSSLHDGMGEFQFTATRDEQYYAELTTPAGISKHYPLPQAATEGVMMHVTVKDSLIQLLLTSSSVQQITLSAGSRNKTYYTRTVSLQPGVQTVTIPASLFPPGITRFTLISSNQLPFAERIAFLHTDKLLQLYITTDKKEYSPREKVTMYVTTLDEHNNPVPADCSLSVIDDKLWSLADDKQDHMVSWLMMSSELQGKIEEPQFYFKKEEPASLPALDLVMLTHGYRYFNYTDEVKKHGSFVYNPDGGFIISGTVTDTAGNPVAATVYLLSGQQYYSLGNNVIKQQTLSNGLFFFNNLPPSWNYKIIARSNRKKQPLIINIEKQGLSDDTAYLQSLKGRLTGEPLPVTPNGKLPALAAPQPIEISAPPLPGLSDGNNLYDVVVVGYGTIRRKEMTSALSIVNNRELSMQPVVTEALEGKVAGISVTKSGSPGSGTRIAVRGASSISGNNEPLWIIDGMPVDNLSKDLDANAIQDITVLKDAQATAIYGSRAVNGVIIVNTKNNMYGGMRFRLSQPFYYATKDVQITDLTTATRSFYAPYYSSTRTRERSDFRETIYWNPVVQTDSCGEAVVRFFNSDATTTFRAIAEGIGYNGKAGHTEATWASKPPITMDAKIPPYFTTGDTAYIPVTIKNNRVDTFLATVEAATPQFINTGWFNKRLYLLPDSSTQLLIPVTATNATEGRIEITVNNYRDTSTLSLPITVVNKGYNVTTTIAGTKPVNKQFNVRTAAPGTILTHLSFYHRLEGQLVDGIEAMLHEPHGCFEQTSSTTYPNLFILKYLRATGYTNPETEAKAMKYLNEGYQRLISFETREHGFEWFGHTPASETLTAYGLMEFTDMQEFVNVDKNMLERTKKLLLDRRDHKGGFIIKHNQFHSIPYEISDIYIVYALTQTGAGKEIQPEYQAAVSKALKSNNTYQLAMMALAASNIHDSLNYRKLMNALPHSSDKQTITFVYSGGKSVHVETAALYALALAREAQPDVTAMAGQIEIILEGNNFFGYGSTQATVLALKAIMEFRVLTDKKENQGKISFTINDTTVVPGEDLSGKVHEGNNTFTATCDGSNNIPYKLKVSYFSLQPPNSPNAPFTLSTKLKNSTPHVGETVRLDIAVTNNEELYQPMTIAKIGIPAGLTVQPWQLKQLTEQQQIAYYEIFDNYLVLYWMGVGEKLTKTISLDLKAEIPGSYTGRASNAYLYYAPELLHWNAGLHCTVLP